MLPFLKTTTPRLGLGLGQGRAPDSNALLFFLVYYFLSTLQSTTATRSLRRHGLSTEAPSELVEEDTFSSLSDIWLCMGIAFGWTIFMVRPLFHKMSMVRYATEGIPIKGHVLEAKVDMAGGDTPGIPAYHAVIDYIYDQDGNTLQIRKAFTTDQLLEQGFANVELLVLPDQPTSGILQKDWETKYARDQEEELAQTRMQRITLGLGGIFCILSIAGAVHAVRRLPEQLQLVGWIYLAGALLLLGPVAFYVYGYSQRCYVAAEQSIHKGMILRGASPYATGYNVGAACIADPCHAMSGLDAPCRHSNRQDDIISSGTPQIKPRKLTKAEQFYFVCMPRSRDEDDDEGSVSTVSSIFMKSFSSSLSKDADDVSLNTYN